MPPTLTASEIRSQFVDFFVERGHRHVPSMAVFPMDDPTLLFTNAGMNQFKDVFLGLGTRSYNRAANSQKCIRVSGKHNDLEEVGRDTYHHTFFEMLGNWSFGDYFKEEAIPWAWELLTDVWGLPKERLWVSVFGGDDTDGLPIDEDAERIWREKTDIDPSRILRFDRRDNFWEMGETGPCGPCTEIHMDRGGPDSDPADGADPSIGVNAGNERFIELWNLVFMEFNRLGDGSLKKLPAQHVDTGLGLERIVAVLQGKNSNYDTDLFTPIFDRLGEVTGLRYESGDAEADMAFRVCADHIRAVSVALADGALPSNTGRGYVMRRLIRRAARYGRQTLGMEDPFLFELVGAVADILGDAYPELRERADHIRLVIKEEETSFARTLGRGFLRFEKMAKTVEARGETELPGKEAYELYATFGLPQDLVELMARERDLTLDLDGWQGAEDAHVAVSKTEGKFKQMLTPEQMEGLPATERTYHADGDRVSADAKILGLFPDAGLGEVLVLNRSPFYPEGGGQIGDTGTVATPEGRFRFTVSDTRVLGDLVVHLGTTEGSASVGDAVKARVEVDRRESVQRNHTATHLLHKALRLVLGDHVTQQGSYVGPDRLRFDFSHPRGMTPEEIDRVETEVNLRIRGNAGLTGTLEETAAAMERGVVALFGEKYGEKARVVEVGDSIELCGGTHVHAAGDIGTFAVSSESAIQAGVRRIEALTGAAAVEHAQSQRMLLREASRALNVGVDDIPGRIGDLLKQVKEAKKAQKASSKADLADVYGKLKESLQERDGVLVGALDMPDLDSAALRDLGSRTNGIKDLAVALFGRQGDRVPFLILCKGAALERGLDAGKLAKQVSSQLGGGGGGRPDSAQGQGENPAALPDVLSTLGETLGA